MRRLLAAFARNTVFANIVLVLFLLVGALAAMSMLRENFPEFSLDMLTIEVTYPGADPEEVEEGISRKIEETLETVVGIKQITTNSAEGRASAWIEVDQNYDTDEVLDQVRTRINAISTFPTDAEKPVVSEMTVRDSVLLLYLAADMPERRIKEWSERLKDELQLLPEVSQVSIFGVRDYEIAIEVSEERLREYGLSLAEVSAAVRRSNLNMAGGTIRTRGEEIRVRTMGRKYTGAELADIVVLARPGGEIITLDRLARIDDGFNEDPIDARVNGEPATMLIVYKTSEEDALAISKAVHTYLERRASELPEGVNLSILYDNTDMLRDRIDLLVKNGLIGMVIVFLTLYLFLNARLSFWSGMGIPVSVAGALAVLWAMGGTVNMISLFSLIMVLGIVVDDAIVVGEAIYVHRQQGKPPLQAAVDGVMEVGGPVVAAVLTSVVAFLPLMYVGGIMGKFIAILPVVVIACLAVSLIECLFLLPAHLSHLPDPDDGQSAKSSWRHPLRTLNRLTSRGLEWVVDTMYLPFLKTVLQWRYISLSVAIAVLLLAVGLIRGGILKFEVFPEVDGFVINAHATFPNGTPPEVTRQAIAQIDAALLRLADKTPTSSGEPLILDRLSLVGQTLEDHPSTGPHVGSVRAILLDSEQRGIQSKELMIRWEKEIGAISGIRSLELAGLQNGPPGDPIEVWIQGHDMPRILAAAEDLMARLRKFNGLYQVRSDFAPGKNEIRLALKPEARPLGLTVDDLARQVNAGYYGSEAIRLQRGRDDVRVKVRYTADERRNLSDLEQVRIRTPAGHEAPLMSVAEISYAPGYSTITRTDGMRRVAISAAVDSSRANANEIFAELNATYFPDLKRRFPDLQVALQGEQKKMRESFSSLEVGFPIAILGIFIVIATIFRSYVQPFVILLTVPFGIIGAVVGHLLFNYQLSIMSIFGMVALTGVVVNDAIILIERVNENIAGGMAFFDALTHAGARRFRAIVLTSISTIGGLAPLIVETDFQARSLIPMALSIAAGVAFATVLTLVLIPSLLAILNDLRRLAFWLRHNRWPARVDVEPARDRHIDPLDHAVKPLPEAGSPGSGNRMLIEAE